MIAGWKEKFSHVPLSQVESNSVFLNIPYDEEFQQLHLAYIVGLYQFRLVPCPASGIPGGERRLDRILALIRNCRYSIHDLSGVELSVNPPATPRFNMPVELGMTITWEKLHPSRHTWFVWESSPFRLRKSMSDLNGTDPDIHFGEVEGVLSELRNALVSRDAPPVQAMMEAYRKVSGKLERVFASSGTRNAYSPTVFKELSFWALAAARNAKEAEGQ